MLLKIKKISVCVKYFEAEWVKKSIKTKFINKNIFFLNIIVFTS